MTVTASNDTDRPEQTAKNALSHKFRASTNWGCAVEFNGVSFCRGRHKEIASSRKVDPGNIAFVLAFPNTGPPPIAILHVDDLGKTIKFGAAFFRDRGLDILDFRLMLSYKDDQKPRWRLRSSGNSKSTAHRESAIPWVLQHEPSQALVTAVS